MPDAAVRPRWPVRERAGDEVARLLGDEAVRVFEGDTTAADGVQLLDVNDVAAAAIATVAAWLADESTEIEVAATILRDRPGDTDLTAARAQVREVLDAVSDALDRVVGPMEW